MLLQIRRSLYSVVDRPKGYFNLPERKPYQGRVLQCDRQPITGKAFKDIFELRSVKHRCFLGLFGRECNVVFIQYEKLVSDPAKVFDFISNALQIPIVGTPRLPEERFVETMRGQSDEAFLRVADVANEDKKRIFELCDEGLEIQLGYDPYLLCN